MDYMASPFIWGYPNGTQNFENYPFVEEFCSHAVTWQLPRPQAHMEHVSHSLNSLKGGYIGDYIGDYYRAY